MEEPQWVIVGLEGGRWGILAAIPDAETDKAGAERRAREMGRERGITTVLLFGPPQVVAGHVERMNAKRYQA